MLHWLMALVLALGLSAPAQALRIKEVAAVQGVRSNQLSGYGLVVGLDGTGDQSTQMPFTAQAMSNYLQQMGISLPPGAGTPQLKNVATVVVTAQLPAFAQPGQTIDVAVSSIGNAKSLKGGTLIATPLRGADGQIYALAQGNLVVGGAGAAAGGSKVQVNHLSAGRIPDGAQVERSVPTPLHEGDSITLDLNATDFQTARKVALAINARAGQGAAPGLGRLETRREAVGPRLQPQPCRHGQELGIGQQHHGTRRVGTTCVHGQHDARQPAGLRIEPAFEHRQIPCLSHRRGFFVSVTMTRL